MSHPHNPRSFGNPNGVPTTHLPHGRSRSQGGSVTESNPQRHSGGNPAPHPQVPVLPPRTSSGQPNYMPPGVQFPNNPGYPNINNAQFSYNNSSNPQFNPHLLPPAYQQLPGQVPQSIQPMVSPQSAQNFSSFQRASLYLPNSGSNHNTSSIPHHSGGGQGHNFTKHSSLAEQQSSAAANFPQEFVPPSVTRPSISHQHWSSQSPAVINSGSQLRGSSSQPQDVRGHHHHQRHEQHQQQFQHQHQHSQSGHTQQQHSQGQPNSTSPADDYYPSRQRNRRKKFILNYFSVKKYYFKHLATHFVINGV